MNQKKDFDITFISWMIFIRYVCIYLLKQKGEAIEAFNHFLAIVKNQCSVSIKVLRSDNGRKYTKIYNVCTNLGIISQLSCPCTSTQNERAEQKHRHIVKIGLTLLVQASLPS